MMVSDGKALAQQRLRPEGRAKSRRESERGWGPASIEKSRPKRIE